MSATQLTSKQQHLLTKTGETTCTWLREFGVICVISHQHLHLRLGPTVSRRGPIAVPFNPSDLEEEWTVPQWRRPSPLIAPTV